MASRRATRWLAIALVLGCSDASTAPPAGDVARLVLAPDAASIPLGESRPLTVSFQDEAGAEIPPVPGVFWSSSSPEVASVTQDGVVTALAIGETQVAASLAGRSATARIAVVPQPVAAVQVSPGSVSLRVAQTASLSAVTLSGSSTPLEGRAVTWSTANAAVAAVSDAGVVTAVGPGSTRISATSEGVVGGADVTVSPAALKTISITPPSPTVGVGQSVLLTAVLVDELGGTISGRTVAWSAANAGIATVGTDGRVTGISPGTTTVTAGLDGVAGTATVTVTAGPVSQVTISPPTASLTVGQTATLSATLRDAGGNVVTGQPVTWRSNTTAVATITSGGVVRGMAAGTSIITATVGAHTGTAVVTVSPVPVASVSIAPTSASVFVGETVKLTATPRAADGTELTGRVVSWSSSNESRASVSSTGLVRGVSPGSVTITATSEGKQRTAEVTVNAARVGSVTVSPTSLGLTIGETDRLTATVRDPSGSPLTGRSVTWTTSDAAVATVTGEGVVQAIATGSATITATSEGKSGTSTVTVSAAPVATVSVTPATATLAVGESRTLVAETRDARGNVLTGRSVTWTTSNAAVATVTDGGVVTAVAAGAATITATSEGKSDAAAITVSVTPVETVDVAPPTASVRIGETVTLTATPRAADGTALTGRVIVWNSSDDSKATVSSSGVVTGRALGDVTISATSEGKTGSASITVAPVAVASLVVAPNAATLEVGGSTTLVAEARDAGGNVLSGRSIVWTSSNEAAATVSSGGLVTAVAVGAATISATSEGVAGTAAITVNPPPPVVASVSIDPSGAELDIGQTVVLTATPRTSGGEAITGRTIVWTSADPAIASVDAAGLVTAVRAGRTDIRATVDAVEGSASVRVRPMDPSLVERLSGNEQTGEPGTALPAPLVVRVLSALGHPSASVTVRADASSKDGEVTPAEALTGDDGTASFIWRLPPEPARGSGKRVQIALRLPDYPSVAPAEFVATARSSGGEDDAGMVVPERP